MAVANDTGECANCSAKNSTSATKCHSCGQNLPWVKPPKAAKPAREASAREPMQLDIPVLPIAGALVFLAGVVLWFGNVLGFMPTFPGAGYIVAIIGAAMWRAGTD
jgi:ribosomal protein L40E